MLKAPSTPKGGVRFTPVTVIPRGVPRVAGLEPKAPFRRQASKITGCSESSVCPVMELAPAASLKLPTSPQAIQLRPQQRTFAVIREFENLAEFDLQCWPNPRPAMRSDPAMRQRLAGAAYVLNSSSGPLSSLTALRLGSTALGVCCRDAIVGRFPRGQVL
jgi:hypothetical protein